MPEVITADFVDYRLRKPDYTEADIDAFAARERVAGGRPRSRSKHEEVPEGAIRAESVLKKAGGAGGILIRRSRKAPQWAPSSSGMRNRC